MYKLRVSKVPPEFWEEANQALLLWEQGTETHRPDYLSPLPWPLNLDMFDTRARVEHTSSTFYIGMLVED